MLLCAYTAAIFYEGPSRGSGPAGVVCTVAAAPARADHITIASYFRFDLAGKLTES